MSRPFLLPPASARAPFIPVLQSTARALLAPGRGLLAADESIATLGRRFAAHDIPFTRDNRLAYRELILTTSGLGEFVSGAILFDETLGQLTDNHSPLPSLLTREGIIVGVKVDTGARALPAFPGETTTRGLDNLRARLADYTRQGARFTKWRAVFKIGGELPTPTAIATNARLLALFAATSQEAGLVPIVEPEILVAGDHTLDRCERLSHDILGTVIDRLVDHRVALDGLLLKTSMVMPGTDCAQTATDEEIAEATLRMLRRTVPAAVPGILFLSGGQTEIDATERLNAICLRREDAPWTLSFSFGRALLDSVLQIWNGDAGNVVVAQAELLRRARLNALAVQGLYPTGSEHVLA